MELGTPPWRQGFLGRFLGDAPRREQDGMCSRGLQQQLRLASSFKINVPTTREHLASILASSIHRASSADSSPTPSN